MPTPEEIEAVLPKLGRGARINIKLDDGQELVGSLYGLFDGLVYFEEEDGIEPIEVGRIKSILMRRITEDPGGLGGPVG